MEEFVGPSAAFGALACPLPSVTDAWGRSTGSWSFAEGVGEGVASGVGVVEGEELSGAGVSWAMGLAWVGVGVLKTGRSKLPVEGDVATGPGGLLFEGLEGSLGEGGEVGVDSEGLLGGLEGELGGDEEDGVAVGVDSGVLLLGGLEGVLGEGEEVGVSVGEGSEGLVGGLEGIFGEVEVGVSVGDD